MGISTINLCVLWIVTKRLGKEFSTKDVSQHPLMTTAHPIKAKHTHFHAFVGRAISKNRHILMVKEIKKGTKRGSIWRKI
ncbi:MAG: hypothetical protein K0B06_04100 [Brevefilum sp.]|nr:hypothetical protein [Brevefilum sp.]